MVFAVNGLSGARSLLQHWRKLEEVAENGWVLSTSQVKQLTSAKSKGAKWHRGSFVFIKSGEIACERSWLVKRQ